MKVAFLSIHPAPYRDDTLVMLSKYKNIDLSVLTILSSADTHKEWNYHKHIANQVFLKNGYNVPFLGITQFGIFKFLKGFDVIVVSGCYPGTNFLTLLYCWIRNIPYVYCADTVFEGEKLKHIRKYFLNMVFSRAAAFWLTGEMSKRYFRKYHVPDEKMFSGYYTNDNSKIIGEIEMAKNNRADIREKYCIEEDVFLFLFIGKLIPTRKIENLLLAFSSLSVSNRNVKLLVVGNGPEEEIIDRYRMEGIVHIESIPYADMHQLYAIADAYVHSGWEPYSLAIVEAVVAGLPIIATDSIGAVAEYVTHGRNGFVVKEDDLTVLRKSLELTVAGEYDETYISEMAEFLIKNRSIEWSAEQLYQAINLCRDSEK